VSAQSGAVSKSRYITQGSASLAIAGDPTYAADGTIYLNEGYLSAIDPVTLAEKWSLGASNTWPVVVGKDGTLFQAGGGINTKLRALSPTNGSEKWSRDLLTYLKPPVVLPDGSVATVIQQTGTSNLVVRIFDAATGADVDAISVPDSGISAPSMIAGSSDGTIYFPGYGKLHAVATTAPRAVKWSSPMNASSVAYDEKAEKLFVLASGATSGLRIGTVDTATGTPTFGPQISGSDPSAIALGEDGWVYFTIQGGTLVGYDTKTNTKWEASTAAWQTTPVVGGDGTIYIAAHKQYATHVQAFTKSGTLKWDKLLSTSIKNSSRAGAAASISPTGHLHVLFAVNDGLFQLGP